jgi:hypothetical protein
LIGLAIVVFGVIVVLAERSGGRSAQSAKKARVVGRCLVARGAEIVRNKSSLAFAQPDAERGLIEMQSGEALDREDFLIAEQYYARGRPQSGEYRLVILFEQHDLSHPETPAVQRALISKAINEPQTLPLVAVLHGPERPGHEDFWECSDRVAPRGV